MIFGSTSRNKASRFIEEIPEDLIVRSRSREWKKPKPGTCLPTSAFEARVVTTESARNFGPAGVTHSEPPTVQLKAGDSVVHKTFGTGMVISAAPMGNDTLLEIAFEESGTKKLMANFARLQKA